jgi:hypothetical protein
MNLLHSFLELLAFVLGETGIDFSTSGHAAV